MNKLVITIISFFLLFSCTKEKTIELAHLYKLPEFTLVNQDNKEFSSKDLLGKVYFASFVFTKCAMSCPKTLAALKQIQGRLDTKSKNLMMVTISVDPENDTPARLKAKALEFQAKEERWVFLTGTVQQIEDLVLNGFKTAMSKVINDLGDTIDVAHSDKFVLVDKKGRVRGFFGRENNDELDTLLLAMEQLEKE